MWIKNFYNECKAWLIVRKVIKQNKRLMDKAGLKSDWFGRIYKVINRDTEIELGSDEDSVYLQNDLAAIWNVLVKLNIADILAYELTPLENVEYDENSDKEYYEHGYLIVLTPAWNLDKQYVTWKSLLGIFILLSGIIGGIVYSIVNFL